ncbi:oxidoreductase [Skermanella aerolata]|uniref:Oxidoreductase n=1 Tax=Skermanella aerolata TaxID=393310 RepID=A0A512DNF9_9PROT|nr:aldo/keto reductase [Skermanella aerolata]KJB94415.1 aldo/keto reductase [Skermanella aerolata KACC 11604]GEO38006.1 oxidoreductase [Skermanella aerolata]
MERRNLGRAGLVVSVIGLGCSGMTGDYGVPDDVESVATIHRALELGVNFFDTSDAYADGRNEQLIAGAIAGRRDGLVLATKFGNIRGPNGERGGVNGRPEHVFKACDASLRRLGIDVIDLLYQHRVDPDVPIAETVGAMSRLVEQGKVRFIGLCEAGPETIRRAHATHPVSALQMEYSLWTRDAEDVIIPVLRELGIGLVPYSPLGRGFLTGTFRRRDDLIPADRRHAHPRFQEGNFERNLGLLETLDRIADANGRTSAQVALAWVLSRGPDIVPIPGTKHRSWLEQNVAAARITLDDADLKALDEAFPPGAASGLRYPEGQLRRLGI